MEAPGSCKGSGRGPQSSKQGLLCRQEEAAVPQDKGNCQCRAGVSLQLSLYNVSWTVQYVILIESVQVPPLTSDCSHSQGSNVPGHMHGSSTAPVNTQLGTYISKYGKQSICCH